MVTFPFLRALLVLMFAVLIFLLLQLAISWAWPLIVLYWGRHLPLYFFYLSHCQMCLIPSLLHKYIVFYYCIYAMVIVIPILWDN
jgi:hypothetical protein